LGQAGDHVGAAERCRLSPVAARPPVTRYCPFGGEMKFNPASSVPRRPLTPAQQPTDET
jgi:hypothetical protein